VKTNQRTYNKARGIEKQLAPSIPNLIENRNYSVDYTSDSNAQQGRQTMPTAQLQKEIQFDAYAQHRRVVSRVQETGVLDGQFVGGDEAIIVFGDEALGLSPQLLRLLSLLLATTSARNVAIEEWLHERRLQPLFTQEKTR
jgi:hypothetical protein